MATGSSFTALPVRRYAAFFADAAATFVLFLVVGVVGEALAVDLGRWDAFAIVWFLYQGTLLAFNQGQTFGRYLTNIVVYGESGSPLIAGQAYFRSLVRVLPVALLEGPHEIPIVGSLVLLALVVVETRLIERSSTRQSVADRLAKSLVVNLPPPHTHRAPAGPMFSESDGEFGHPPKRPRK
jgi:uncharacterized RDD family membrane protein YckC